MPTFSWLTVSLMCKVFLLQIICDCMERLFFEHMYMSLHIFKNVSSSLSISNCEILKMLNVHLNF
jgi:hypothetical protein